MPNPFHHHQAPWHTEPGPHCHYVIDANNVAVACCDNREVAELIATLPQMMVPRAIGGRSAAPSPAGSEGGK